MPVRTFDLNIETVLENWEVAHALREIIANALDEQVLSASPEIAIKKDERGNWHIRDFGRGLRIEHFTLNENQEKLNAPSGVIGKCGVGLKDALATLHRRGIEVQVTSPYGTYRLCQAHKHGFSDILTLHVEYDDSPTALRGTEVLVCGVSDSDIATAKSLFMKFAGEKVLEVTPFGEVLRRQGGSSRVYIYGVLANDEPNFLFSYNVTSLTESMRKRLNRERLNVGRTTYAERVRAILRCATTEEVQAALVADVEKRATGEQSDELAWIEIGQLALTLMHRRRKVAYVTEQELQSQPGIVERARADGLQVVVVTAVQKTTLEAQAASGGPEVRLLEFYIREYNASFQYKFVGTGDLTPGERHVFLQTPRILALIGLTMDGLPAIRISETMRITSDNTEGVWDSSLPAIVIRRTTLGSLQGYAGTLLHEVAHASTGTADATRAFEAVLTDYLGATSAAAIRV